MNIEAIAEAITEATAEAIRDYDILRSIDEIRTDTNMIISELLTM